MTLGDYQELTPSLFILFTSWSSPFIILCANISSYVLTWNTDNDRYQVSLKVMGKTEYEINHIGQAIHFARWTQATIERVFPVTHRSKYWRAIRPSTLCSLCSRKLLLIYRWKKLGKMRISYWWADEDEGKMKGRWKAWIIRLRVLIQSWILYHKWDASFR